MITGTLDTSLLKQLAGMHAVDVAAPIPDSLVALADVTTQEVQGRTAWHLIPKAGASDSTSQPRIGRSCSS